MDQSPLHQPLGAWTHLHARPGGPLEGNPGNGEMPDSRVFEIPLASRPLLAVSVGSRSDGGAYGAGDRDP